MSNNLSKMLQKRAQQPQQIHEEIDYPIEIFDQLHEIYGNINIMIPETLFGLEEIPKYIHDLLTLNCRDLPPFSNNEIEEIQRRIENDNLLVL